MKVPMKLISILLVVLLLCGCAPSVDNTLADIAALGESPDDNYRTWYEIFVYSFCDSDGDGIGDINGVRSKLDYLEKMGINGIWLMPIHSSTTYHKYNVTDYYSIDPDYGTIDHGSGGQPLRKRKSVVPGHEQVSENIAGRSSSQRRRMSFFGILHSLY